MPENSHSNDCSPLKPAEPAPRTTRPSPTSCCIAAGRGNRLTIGRFRSRRIHRPTLASLWLIGDTYPHQRIACIDRNATDPGPDDIIARHSHTTLSYGRPRPLSPIERDESAKSVYAHEEACQNPNMDNLGRRQACGRLRATTNYLRKGRVTLIDVTASVAEKGIFLTRIGQQVCAETHLCRSKKLDRSS